MYLGLDLDEEAMARLAAFREQYRRDGVRSGEGDVPHAGQQARVRGAIPTAPQQEAIEEARASMIYRGPRLRHLARRVGVPVPLVQKVLAHLRRRRDKPADTPYWYGERELSEPERCPRCRARVTRMVGDVCSVCFALRSTDNP